MTAELTKDELVIINNALNEVCNGIHTLRAQLSKEDHLAAQK